MKIETNEIQNTVKFNAKLRKLIISTKEFRNERKRLLTKYSNRKFNLEMFLI